jgi:hypothetical protein
MTGIRVGQARVSARGLRERAARMIVVREARAHAPARCSSIVSWMNLSFSIAGLDSTKG